MNNRVIIINKTQFGYHTDYYKYCQYLKNTFSITFICFDLGYKKLLMPGIDVKYISAKNHKIIRGAKFIISVLLTCFWFDGIIFIHYFEKCHLIKLIMPWKKVILDIRSLCIKIDEKQRIKYDKKIKKTTKYFNYVTIISNELRKKINLNYSKSAILPLGADIISTVNKEYIENINMLYIGTLNGRNIHQTIVGLHKYIKTNNIKKI